MKYENLNPHLFSQMVTTTAVTFPTRRIAFRNRTAAKTRLHAATDFVCLWNGFAVSLIRLCMHMMFS